MRGRRCRPRSSTRASRARPDARAAATTSRHAALAGSARPRMTSTSRSNGRPSTSTTMCAVSRYRGSRSANSSRRRASGSATWRSGRRRSRRSAARGTRGWRAGRRTGCACAAARGCRREGPRRRRSRGPNFDPLGSASEDFCFEVAECGLALALEEAARSCSRRGFRSPCRCRRKAVRAVWPLPCQWLDLPLPGMPIRLSGKTSSVSSDSGNSWKCRTG